MLITNVTKLKEKFTKNILTTSVELLEERSNQNLFSTKKLNINVVRLNVIALCRIHELLHRPFFP